MFKKILSLGALLAVSMVPSNAATISFSDSVSTSFTPNTLSFTLSQFDTTLGTLTGITIEFSSVLNGSFSAQNLSNSAGTLNGNLSGVFTLDGPAPLAMPLLTLNPASNFGPINVPANDTVAFQVLNLMADDSYSTGAPLELAPFMGLGTIGFNGTASALAAAGGNVNPLIFISDLSGEATVSITYTYDDGTTPNVPEPMTMYLMGGGLLALGFIRPRKKSA